MMDGLNEMGKREQFLLHFYDQLWGSITRAEQGLWQFVAAFVVVIGGQWALGEKQPVLAAYVAIIVLFWAINVTINAGKWFEHNRIIIIHIEKEFIQNDVGKIIPASYHERRTRWWFTPLYIINVLVFTFIMMVFIYYKWDAVWAHVNPFDKLITIVLVIGGLVGTTYHWWRACKELKDLVEKTGGNTQ